MNRKLSVPLHGAAALALAVGLAAGPAVAAECDIEGQGTVNTISNAYPALDAITDKMQSCSGDGLEVSTKLTTEHKEETLQAFESGNSPFHLAQIATSDFGTLMSKGLLAPMTDLVEKYRDEYDIQDQMLVTQDGEVYAVAFMVNAQHLFYRKDLLEQAGIEPPQNYDEFLAAAEQLEGTEGIDFPIGATFATGWNLGTEFTNLFLAEGGQFFEEGTAEPTFNSPEGVAALETMKAMMDHMSPNALQLATGDVINAFQQGRIAMANMWASRAAAMDDEQASMVVDKIGFAAAPAAKEGGPPATTIFWDGWVMPKGLSEEQRDLAFRVLMEGIETDVVEENNDVTIWLSPAYKPNRYADGVNASMEQGAPSFPNQPYFALAHGALGNNLGDFLAGSESAEQSLEDAERAYRQAATEQGFL